MHNLRVACAIVMQESSVLPRLVTGKVSNSSLQAKKMTETGMVQEWLEVEAERKKSSQKEEVMQGEINMLRESLQMVREETTPSLCSQTGQ